MYIIDEIIDRNNPTEKLSSVIYGLLVSSLVINILMDFEVDKARKKQIVPILLCWYINLFI